MKSNWFELKEKAIKLRKEAYSIRSIEHKLKIPRSTLSGWFKSVMLTNSQQQKLKQEWLEALVKARQKAVVWHNAQKAARLAQAEQEAKSTLKSINLKDKNVLDLALAMLYLGEGFKKTNETAIGNSDPRILKFFIAALKANYSFDSSRIKCELHLRADQNPVKIKKFWAKELRLSFSNFTTVSVDQRTKGIPTYKDYNGVCVLRLGSVAIQRKLLILCKEYCDSIIDQNLGG